MPGPLLLLLGHSFFSSAKEDNETWNFIFSHMLGELFYNTFALGFLCVIFTLLIGFWQASLLKLTNISGKKWLHLLFLTPLIFPLYVYAFIFVGAFEYSGEFPTFLRENLGLNLLSFFSIKSTLGVGLVFSFALSPYTYLFFSQAMGRLENNLVLSARSLGASPREVIWKIIFPQIRIWGISAAIIVFLEVLCDFGGVSVFNYDTFSTAIYHAWSSLFSLNTAVKLAFFPTLIAVALYTFNYFRSQKQRFVEAKHTLKPFVELKGKGLGVSYLLIGIYVFFSVLFPLIQLALWSLEDFGRIFTSDYWMLILQTLEVGIGVSVLIILAAVLMGLASRFFLKGIEVYAQTFQKIGYALPGSITAISILVLNSFFEAEYIGFLAIACLALGLSIRFYPVAFEMIERSYQRISVKLDWSSQSLGAGVNKTFRHLHLPLLLPGLSAAFIMVLIELIKEMPITLILRPYGVNTLATKVFELTSEGEWEKASLPALFLVLIGIVAIMIKERQNMVQEK